MKSIAQKEPLTADRGFTLIEVLIAMVLTLAVMGSVFGLLIKGQESFRREPQIADLNQSARVGLDRITRDLTMAGYKTPSAQAIWWNDGGGITPDEITIIYADPNIPTAEPLKCGAGTEGGGQGPCKTINKSSTLKVDPQTMDPYLANATQAYKNDQILFALEKDDCNKDGEMGFHPFVLTQPPQWTAGDTILQLNHNPGEESGINSPSGFNREVHPDCAVIGVFRVIQYRVSPSLPTPNPQLERRDLSTGEPWMPVAHNIENLQLQYSTAVAGMLDSPAPPDQADPNTWITRVRVTVFGRTESTNLQGASQGVFSPEDTHLRKSFSTAVSPRNQSFQAGLLTSAQAYN
jgi:prepilin-type N-terminal cleavage/methylation domain-containing protein